MNHHNFIKVVVSCVLLITSSSFLTAAPPEGVTPVSPNDNQAKSFRPDSILVRFKSGTSDTKVNTAHGNVNPKSVKSFKVISGLKHVILPPGRSLEDALATYRKNPNVLYAEPDYQYQLNAVPNDPFYNTLWAINNSSQDIPQLPYAGSAGTFDADINAQEAWDNVVIPPASGVWNSTTGGYAEVVVAVIDTGVDYYHPDLAANMWINPGETASNGTDDDGNGYVDDVYGINPFGGNTNPDDTSGHGTHVAGTIAAEGNNASGVIGAAWNAKILPCTAGNSSTVDSSAAIVCMEYFYELKTRTTNPVNIVVSNNSWGGTGYSQAVYDAIDMQRQAGILFVAAAGNSNVNNDTTPHYPAGYHLPNIIAVANTTNTDAKSSSSNYGRRSVTVGAPGDAILSTYPIGYGSFQDASYTFFNEYAILQGTSMAAPQVSGLIALVSTQDTNRDWKAIKNLIISSGTPISALTNTTVSGRRISAWDTDGTGAMSCVNQTVNSTLHPQSSSTLAQAGQLGLAVLNINCDVGAGNVIVSTTGASSVADLVLLDDGSGFDKEAGDGIYSAYWYAPSTSGSYTLTFPDGQTAGVTVDASMTPYRQAQSVTPVFETFTDTYSAINFPSGSYVGVTSSFPIKYGDHNTGFSSLYISNGWISFNAPSSTDALNAGLPASQQNTFVAPFWDDLNSYTTGSVHVGNIGTSPNRKMIIEWRDVSHTSHAGSIRFQVVFNENNSDVQVNYFDATFGNVIYDLAASATIGMQIHNSSATEFSYNSSSITDNSSYLWQTNSGAPTSINAGVDQNVSGGTLVNLSGSATDPDGGALTYSWAQLSGTSVTLTNPNTATPSFTAANITETVSFIMTVQDDAGFTGSDIVNINVTAAPTAGILQFSATTYSVIEDEIFATITVTRSSGVSGAISVDYDSSNGTASAGDYTTSSGVLNWLDNDSADKTFTVLITDDTVLENDETINLTLSNITGSASLGTSNSTLTITDNDIPGTLSFSAPTYSVAESGTTATITVNRTVGSDGAISVDYASANGTATATSDYTAASGTLNWSHADSAAKTFTIAITNDTLLETNETVNLTLSNITGDATLGTSNATLTITDNDIPGTLSFSAPTYSVAESGTTATITVNRTVGSDGAISVDYASANGTATATSDYTAASGTLNWSHADSAAKTFTVAISDDSSYEIDETINLTLSNASGGATLGTSTSTLTITDNDAVPGTLAFSATNYSVDETAITATITISRSGGSDGEVSVDYNSADGTASAGSDYSANSGTLTWLNGDSEDKTFTISITDDVTYETDETISLTLSNVTGASLGNSNATLTITDNDAVTGTLALNSSTYSVNENGGTVTITISRTGGSDGIASIDFTTVNDTATAIDDFTSTSGTLIWSNADSSDKTFNIPITNDSTYEATETLIVNLSNVAGASLGLSSATVSINDDDAMPGTISFNATAYSVDENGVTTTITVSRTGGSDGVVSVDYASANNTATAGSDYEAVTGTFIWNNADNADKTFTIAISDDSIYEGNESITLSLNNITGGATTGTSDVILTIVENDTAPLQGSLSISSTNDTIAENSGSFTVSVTRIGGSDGDVSIDYATNNNTALASSDFVNSSGTLNWLDGDASDKTITIYVSDDSIYESTENFSIVLSNPQGGADIGNSSVVMSIVDNDAVPGTLGLTETVYSISETGLTATISVKRTGSSDGIVTVDYVSSNGTAIAGTDFMATTGSLSWANGDTANKTFTVEIINDDLYELNETVLINIFNPTNGASLGITSSTLSIIDNDAVPGTISLSAITYSVIENINTATITVNRTVGSNGAVSVDYTTADITALAGTDYTATSGTLNWADSDTASKTVIINIVDDTIFEDDESLQFNLTNLTGSATPGTSSATLTITDDDLATPVAPGNQPPTAPNLVSPGDGVTNVLAYNTMFTWNAASDADGDFINYQLFYCDNPDFNGCDGLTINTSLSSADMVFGIGGGMGLMMFGVVSTASRRKQIISMLAIVMVTLMFSGCDNSGITIDQVSVIVNDVQPNSTYYWKVVADDGNGGLTSSPVWSFSTL